MESSRAGHAADHHDDASQLDIRGDSSHGAGGSRSPDDEDGASSTKELHHLGPQYYPGSEEEGPRAPWWDVRQWGKKAWIIVAVAVAIIIAIAVPVGVTVERARNRYPNYSRLSYALTETYTPQNFFSKFNYFHGVDPANGFVHYADPEWAANYNLTPSTASSSFLKVDTRLGEKDAWSGRRSVRLSSKTTYDRGLFIFDVKHAPHGCGTWPALWLTDAAHWPEHGEVDIMESLNRGVANTMALHTSHGCGMGVRRIMTGTAVQADCHNTTTNNQGCRVDGPAASTGSDFNARGGGVMALEWRPEGMRIWQFERQRLPPDLLAGRPDPMLWGVPMADFPGTDCDIGAHFRNASITANIDLCGPAMGGGLYESSGCPANCVGSHRCIGSDTMRNNCTDFVATNPGAFTNAFWEFGVFQVYQAI